MPRRAYSLESDGIAVRPLTSDTVRGMLAAAKIFGYRLARKKYGRRGKLVKLRENKPRGNRHFYVVVIGNGETIETCRFNVVETHLPEKLS